ncbi:MAG TPA: hypothetical protein VGI06_01625 [Acidimicrobiales bacterium]
MATTLAAPPGAPTATTAVAPITSRRWVRPALWAAIPLAAVALVATRYRRTYFFYDEWGMIGRVVEGHHHLATAFTLFNGHLVAWSYFAYLAQVRWFGLVGHAPIFVLFCLSLVAMHMALAATLTAFEVPDVVALLAAGAVTYFGPGAQNMVFEVQLSWNFAYAFAFCAAAVVLRGRPSWSRAAAGAALMLVAMGADSVVAVLVGSVLGIGALLRWRRPLALLPIVPAALLESWLWIFAAGNGSFPPPRSVGEAWRFAWRLALTAVGGLVGGKARAGALAVGVVLAALVPVVARRRLQAPGTTALVAGGSAGAGAVVAVTWTRAAVVGSDLQDFNRYIQLGAVFLLVALLPPAVGLAVHRTPGSTPRRWPVAVAVAAVGVVFIANVPTLRAYRHTFEGWNQQSHLLVSESVAVLDHGCPPGTRADPSGQPLGYLGPQVTVGLLQLLRKQNVSLPRATVLDGKVMSLICRP